MYCGNTKSIRKYRHLRIPDCREEAYNNILSLMLVMSKPQPSPTQWYDKTTSSRERTIWTLLQNATSGRGDRRLDATIIAYPESLGL